MDKDSVIRLLMKRDGMSREDAEELVDETIDEIFEDMDNAEEILMDNLMLEPDYLESLL